MKTFSIKIKKLLHYLINDPVLFVAIIATIVSAIFVPPSKEYLKCIDFNVLCLLFCLMIVVAGLQKIGLFSFVIDKLLKIVHNTRTLTALLVGVCFFSGMLITNDVALITFVPFGIMILSQIKKHQLMIPVIVLQTVAANLGSMLTPLGNPQNLYLYSISDMSFGKFLSVMSIPSAISFLLLLAAILFIKSEPIKASPDRMTTETIKTKEIFAWLALMMVCLMTVLHIIPYYLTFVIVVTGTIFLDKKMFLSIDYSLLITFTFLFIFIGNINNIPYINNLLSTLISGRETTVAILISQVISNVPATMLLSKFTSNYPALLLGVNIGGLGTLIASMASLISYKLYVATTGANIKKYLLLFTFVNLIFLTILWSTTLLYTVV